MRSRLALVSVACAVLVMLWGLADSLLPFMTQEREVVASTPSPARIDQRFAVALERGDELCIRPVTLTPRSQLVRFRVELASGPPIPVEVTASAPGYRSTGVLQDYPTPGEQPALARIDPPDRELRGQVCARNPSSRPIQLIGTEAQRSQVFAEPVLNGRALDGKEVELTLLETREESLLARADELVEHAGLVTADFAPEWLLWIVLVLVVAGIPLAAIGGFYLAVRRS